MDATTIPQNEEIKKKTSSISKSATLAWGLFWRYIFSWSSLLFFFAAIVCFFAFNWADLSVFTKFSFIAGLMALAALFPLSRGFEDFAGSAGLLFCGLLAGPLLAVYGQYYQTGANAWELFRTWALFLLPLALVGRRTGLWFTLWLVASLAFFLFLLQQNTLHPRESWVSLPFVFSQIFFLLVWEGAAFSRQKGKLSFLDARWFPRLVAGLILFYLTAVMAELIFDGPGINEAALSPFLSGYGFVYSLFLLFCGFYYTKRVFDLVIIGMGLTGIIATGLMVLADSFSRGWNSGAYLLLFAAYILLASVGGIKLLLFCHRKWGKKTEHREKTFEEAYFPSRFGKEEKNAPQDATAFKKLLFAFTGPKETSHPEASRFRKRDKKNSEETTHWIIPFFMGLAAWLTLPFLLGGIVLLMNGVLVKNSMIVLFLLVMGMGAALSHAKGTFVNQAGLCLALCGTIGSTIFIFLQYEKVFSEYILVPFILLFSIGLIFVPNRLYRLIAASTVFPLLFTQLLLKMKDFAIMHHGNFFWAEPMENTEILHGHGLMETFSNTNVLQETCILLLLLLAFGLFLSALVHFWMREEHGEKKFFLQQPLLSGAFLSVIFFSAILYADAYSPYVHLFNDLLPHALRGFGIGAGIGLVWFSFRISKALSLSSPITVALVVIAILLGLAGIKMYWVPAAFLLLCLARRSASFPLIGLAIAFLSTMTFLEYYNETTSLLEKSYALAFTGFCLGVIAMALHFFFRGKTVSENPKTVHRKKPWKDRLGRGLVLGCLCIFLLLFAGSVREKERLLASGTEIVLALRPVDPRSLMQGDYMVLQFEVENSIASALGARDSGNSSQLEGVALVRVGKNGVAGFSRLDDGSSLAPDEIRLVYRRKSRGIQVGSGAFFFQEGHGSHYDAARFAVLKVEENGQSLITGLLDGKGKKIVGEK